MSEPIHRLGSPLNEKDANKNASAPTTSNTTTLNGDSTIQALSIRNSQPLPFQFDLSFLHKLDQLLPENPLFFMQQQQQQQLQDQAMDNGDPAVSGNHSPHTFMPSFNQSTSNDAESNQSIWSGFNNFFSNVAHNPFPQSIPNLAKNVSEYLSNYQLFSSLNVQAAPNARQGSAQIQASAPGIKYESLMDGSYKPASMDSPRMQIRVLGIPQSGAKSRVETQTKLCLQLVTDNGDKAQRYTHLKLPEHLVARDKLKRQQHFTMNTDSNGSIPSVNGLDDSFTPVKSDTMLFLHARVICASDPSRKVLTCLGCIQRERKRSQRRKENKIKIEHTDADNRLEDEQSLAMDEQKILLFNCSEIVDFSAGDTILPTRITCYCRHHNERLGFCIYFEMQDHTGKPVASGMSPPIMITDDHKSSKLKASRKRPRTDDMVGTSVNTQAILAAATSSFSFGTTASSSSPINIQSMNNNKSYSSINDTASVSSSTSSSPSSNAHPILSLHSSFTNTPFNIDPNQPLLHHHTPQITSTNGRPAATNAITPLIDRSAHGKQGPTPMHLDETLLHPIVAAAATSGISNKNDGNKKFQQQQQQRQPSTTPHGKTAIVEQPQMQRMIPNEGPTDGGIEVTILGTGFRPGLTCMFGDVAAASTHYWSPNTLVCILPPAMAPGAVTVSLKEVSSSSLSSSETEQPLFTYCNDGDCVLMELALQVVGLKMTGKIQDAREIAMRIVDGNGKQVIASNRGHHQQQQQQHHHHHSPTLPTSSSILPSLSSTQQQLSLTWRSLPSVEAIRQLLDDRASGQNALCFDWPRMQMLESPGPWSD